MNAKEEAENLQRQADLATAFAHSAFKGAQRACREVGIEPLESVQQCLAAIVEHHKKCRASWAVGAERFAAEKSAMDRKLKAMKRKMKRGRQVRDVDQARRHACLIMAHAGCLLQMLPKSPEVGGEKAK